MTRKFHFYNPQIEYLLPAGLQKILLWANFLPQKRYKTTPIR